MAQFHSLFNLAANGYLVVKFTLGVQVIGAHRSGGRLGPRASLKAERIHPLAWKIWSFIQLTRGWQIVWNLVSGERYCVMGLWCNQIHVEEPLIVNKSTFVASSWSCLHLLYRYSLLYQEQSTEIKPNNNYLMQTWSVNVTLECDFSGMWFRIVW